MSIITRSVHNTTINNINLFVPGYDSEKFPVIIPASTTIDLFTVLTADQLEAAQPIIREYVAANEFTVTATVDTATFNPVGGGTQVLPQVVQASALTDDSTDSPSLVSTGPTASMTMQKATNRIKVTFLGTLGVSGSATGTCIASIKRDGTVNLNPNGDSHHGGFALVASGQTTGAPVTLVFVDSPGDTLSHTYQAAYYSGDNIAIIRQGFGQTCVIVLEEILS